MAYLTTYQCNADKHILDKSNHMTQQSSNISINFIDDVSTENPTILLSTSVSQSFNYCYIDTLARYYYVTDRVYSKGHYKLTLEVDPLMSFKTAIKNLDVIATRSSSRFNVYQQDNTIPFEQDSIVTAQYFPNGFNNTSFILAVNGG